jgi:hypothetical protein
MGIRDKIKSTINWQTKKVAVFIVNYNMNEMADNLYLYLKENETWPMDIYYIDNGSDIKNPSKHTNVFIENNVQTTNGWLTGLAQSDKKYYNYFAYMFLITSTQFVSNSKKPITSMVQKLIEDENAVGVHASLSKDSTTAWEHLKNRGTNDFRQTWFIDNICSLYRADWFNSIGRFDKDLIYAWGVDLEAGYIARKQGRTLWVDERIQVRKKTDIGYKMKRMNMKAEKRVKLASKNMSDVLSQKYGDDWEDKIMKDYMSEEML